jgi:arabinose-5-phosphate isomerase
MITIPQLAPTLTSSDANQAALIARARSVIDVEIEGLEALKSQLGEAQGQGFCDAVALLHHCQGRVIVTGMGKSGLIGRKIAATLSSTGTPALFLHPAEGSHGDLGVLMAQDVVIAISNSGETPEMLNILPPIKRFGVPLIALTGNPASTLATQSDAHINIAVPQEACPMGLAPTASTTATLAVGDALAVVLLEQKGFTEADFAVFHPAGALGKQLLLQVADLMHTDADLPVVGDHTSFLDALMEITSKKLGLTVVVNDEGAMVGVLTDGDVRRALTHNPDVSTIQLRQVMTVSPKTISAAALAVAALRQMEANKITALVCVDAQQTPVGVLHMHDILRTGIH